MKLTTQKTKREENKEVVLNLLLKEKEWEFRTAKQKAGFFARKHAEALAKIEKSKN